MTQPSLQEFSLIRSKTEKIKEDYCFSAMSSAFYFVVMDLVLGLQDDEISDSITDTNHLKISGKPSGHDRGIDALYIEDTTLPATIHFFNFKYTDKFEKSKRENFPSGEIDKILNFIGTLNQQEESLVQEVNPILASKVKDIWKLFDSQNPVFIFHFCANLYKGFEKNELMRFERNLPRNSEVHFHLIPDLVKYIYSSEKQVINGKIKAIDRGYFEKTSGNIRALVLNVDVRELIRIVLNDKNIREQADMTDEEYESLKQFDILKDSFNDNVRVHQKNSSINKSIKATALSEENNKFFYYNNGITLTCKRFSYENRRGPIIELEDIQVVNGSQTIHSLYEAFLEDSTQFDDIDILCRICEVKDPALSTRIAEYTNSQNPVKSRDIRSVDFIQLNLEKELLIKDKFYERKRNQYSERPLSQRLDAERVGQVLMAFFNRSPYEAKNRKGLIFGDKYEEVFNDEVNADQVLLAYKLFERIEFEKSKVRQEIVTNEILFEEKSYIIHASYYILYILGELARREELELIYSNLEDIWSLYPNAKSVIEAAIFQEREKAGNSYSHSVFFRSNKSKKYFEDLEDPELDELLN